MVFHSCAAASSPTLFRIVRIVEERAQLDTAMPELREVKGATIPRIERGGSIVRRKDHQRVKKCDDAQLLFRRHVRKRCSSCLCLTTVTHDHLHQINTASIVAIWSG